MSSRANITGLISCLTPIVPLVAYFASQGIPLRHWGAFWPLYAIYASFTPVIFVMTRDGEEIRILNKKNEGNGAAL